MRKLVGQSILFMLIAITIIIVLIWFNNRKVFTAARFRVAPGIDMIIAGNSHPECAFNDSLITRLANFSRSGESYFYTYYKLKHLLEQNPQVKTVFIDFSNEQLNTNKDQWIWGARYMGNSYPLYGAFIDREGQQLLAKKNIKSFLNNQSVLLKNNINIIMNRDYDYSGRVGGYIYLVRNQTDSMVAASGKTPAPNLLTRTSEKNLYYLDKMIRLCRELKREIFLIRSPVNPRWDELTNESQFKQLLASRFRDIPFLDFKDFPLANSEYGNLEHLNFRGARKFSIFFNELLSAGLLHQKDKQSFIDKKMHDTNSLQ